MIFYFASSLFALAVTTSFLNILIAAKLFCMSKLQKALSSDAQKNRRRLFIRIFLQSCFQDWIYVLDFINNFCASQYCSEDLCLTVITMGVDVLIYTADGYTQIGPCLLDAYMNQILGYGLLLQGPATQFIITINRFYVICFSPVNIPAYSNHITVAAIAVSWTANGWFGTLIGLPTDCLISFGFEHLDCIWYSDCGDVVGYYQIMIIFILAIANNSMNFLVAIKLFCTAKSLMKMSSGAAKNRRKLSIRFFIQSVVQDWICVLDYFNSFFAMSKICKEIYCIVFMTMGFDVLVYGLDGLVMYVFNRNVEQKSERNSRPNVSDGPTLT
ncbi:hypothetical protein L5515_015475 [Caenorhabditis briggsae]|uniref:7TM GPCR serpentine receptor class x (Srx) domain-containing protein n=1 Tax=Caenorhabditis briggsae TaxID=6238 RepID=A0AAE9EFZ9_CAEBR|nr:hypothetical protein L5515_015475 [Caenorhabditis briggsae]